MSSQPLASLCILFYNQESFVNDTLEGAFSQTYERLEIILSDDNSSDSTYERILQKVENYRGPHKILVNKNEINMGLVPHLNKVLFEIAHGDLLFLNGGDDISLPNRVFDGVNYFKAYKDVYAVTFSSIIIDKEGNEIDRKKEKQDKISKITDVDFLKNSLFMAGADALSLRREVLDFFGKMNNDCQTDDSVLRFRSLLLGEIISSSHFGLKYRVHDHNISRYISNFDTNLIANQYSKDLNVGRNKISTDIYKKLQSKISYYRSHRKLKEDIEKSSNRIYKYILCLRLRMMVVLHAIIFRLKKN